MLSLPPNVVLGIVGVGGFARGVMPELLEARGGDATGVYFVEDVPAAPWVNGIPCIGPSDFFALESQQRYFNVAIANSRIRARIAQEWIARGAVPYSVFPRNVEIQPGARIGQGATFRRFSAVMTNVEIGNYFHANMYAYVGADCTIGDCVTFAPDVRCNIGVRLADHVYVGAGAILGDGKRPIMIGEGAVVGMGAVVTNDVAPYTTVAGNPAALV